MKDQVRRKKEQLADEEDRMARDEEELDDEMSCTRYCLTELRKKETGLLVKQDEA